MKEDLLSIIMLIFALSVAIVIIQWNDMNNPSGMFSHCYGCQLKDGPCVTEGTRVFDREDSRWQVCDYRSRMISLRAPGYSCLYGYQCMSRNCADNVCSNTFLR